jgi:hypothetical protein
MIKSTPDHASASAPATDCAATSNTFPTLVAGPTVPAGVKWNMDAPSAPTDAIAGRGALQSRSDFARSGGAWRPSGARYEGIN